MVARWLAIAALACSCDAFSAAVEESELCIPREIAMPGIDADELVTLHVEFPLELALPEVMTTDVETMVKFRELRVTAVDGVGDMAFVHELELMIRTASLPYVQITEGAARYESGTLVVSGLPFDISRYVFANSARVSARIEADFPPDDWTAQVKFCFAIRLTYH